MSTRILLATLTLVLAFGTSACRSRHASKEAIGNAPAAEMEASFKQRWIDKRVAELSATGVAAPDALIQASKEFDERFNFNPAAQTKSKAKKKK